MLVTNMAQGQVVIFNGITHTFFAFVIIVEKDRAELYDITEEVV